MKGIKFQGKVDHVKDIDSGSKGQGSVQQVADLPGENSKTESAKHGVRAVVIGLPAASQVSSGPQPKRSKGRVDLVKASSSAREQSRHPQERKTRKRVAAEKTTSVPRAHRRARRRVRNGRQEGKLDDTVLTKYLGNLWQTLPIEKKASCAYIDCLWYQMYHIGDREKALRWIRREKIFSKKYVFLPICEYNHWSLLIFCHLGEDLQSKTATPCMLLLDSLPIANAKENLDKNIRTFLSGIYEDEGILESTKRIDKTTVLVPKVPQQTGDKECGYYVLYYITLFLRSAPETFSISDGYPYFMVEDWFTAEEVDSFIKTLPSPDPETGLGDDLSDGGSDDLKLIE